MQTNSLQILLFLRKLIINSLSLGDCWRFSWFISLSSILESKIKIKNSDFLDKLITFYFFYFQLLLQIPVLMQGFLYIKKSLKI